MRKGKLKIVRSEQTMPLIRELSNYHYDETKQIEEPVDEDNHACDALRYLVVGIDRGRHVTSVAHEPTPDEEAIQAELEAIAEASTRKAEFERKQKLEDEARENPSLDDRWFNN
jgi:hypothetical protein